MDQKRKREEKVRIVLMFPAGLKVTVSCSLFLWFFIKQKKVSDF